jgi:rsbT co-antagonist protein RsbR
VDRWVADLLEGLAVGSGRIPEEELRQQASEFIKLLTDALRKDPSGKPRGQAWDAMREFLEEVSRSRAVQGFTSSQTAGFIFSFKKPLFAALREDLGADPQKIIDSAWAATELIDELGLLTVSVFQKTREDLINRQQAEMLEISTPVVKLWEGVLALPMIGTLDSARTQVVMETLLERIVESGSQIAIIDITGVPTVDTLVAQHLLKTATAIRLMGADCIVSGVRPQIAQTIVHLGVDLGGITTKATLADALALAFTRSGFLVAKRPEAGA